jgi:hypothetical protein
MMGGGGGGGGGGPAGGEGMTYTSPQPLAVLNGVVFRGVAAGEARVC